MGLAAVGPALSHVPRSPPESGLRHWRGVERYLSGAEMPAGSCGGAAIGVVGVVGEAGIGRVISAAMARARAARPRPRSSPIAFASRWKAGSTNKNHLTPCARWPSTPWAARPGRRARPASSATAAFSTSAAMCAGAGSRSLGACACAKSDRRQQSRSRVGRFMLLSSR
jgi:hypothetical protein